MDDTLPVNIANAYISIVLNSLVIIWSIYSLFKSYKYLETIGKLMLVVIWLTSVLNITKKVILLLSIASDTYPIIQYVIGIIWITIVV